MKNNDEILNRMSSFTDSEKEQFMALYQRLTPAPPSSSSPPTADATTKKSFAAYIPSSPQNNLRMKKVLLITLSTLAFLAFVSSPVFFVNNSYNSENYLLHPSGLPANVATNLGDLTSPPSPMDTALYWHIPKASGSSVKSYYSCMGLVQASDASEVGGHDQDTSVQIWENAGGFKHVNIDTSRAEGIQKAISLHLAESNLADIIFTMYSGLATDMFTPTHKGRAFALFRHPVDRAVSLFYYRQIAQWEKKEGVYRPELADVEIRTWFEKRKNSKENSGYMVSLLIDKDRKEPITPEDMLLAKRILREKYLVGLTNSMVESVERFDKYFGWYDNARRAECQDLYVIQKKNSNAHKGVEEGSDVWNMIAEKYWADVELYEYAVELFEEQRSLFL